MSPESRWVWRSARGWISIVVTPASAANEVRSADAAASPANRRLASKCGAAIGHLRAAHRFDPATFWRRRRQSPAGERHMMVGPGTGKVDITIAINPCEVLLAANSPGMTAAMTIVIFISIPLWATRVALEQPSCPRQRAASCGLRASITACRHPRHGPSLRAQHDEAFQGREYFSNIFETRRSIRFSTLSREASSAQLRGDRRGDAFANEGVVGLLNVLEAVGPEAGEVMPPSPCGDPTITVRGRRRRRLPGVLSSG